MLHIQYYLPKNKKSAWHSVSPFFKSFAFNSHTWNFNVWITLFFEYMLQRLKYIFQTYTLNLYPNKSMNLNVWLILYDSIIYWNRTMSFLTVLFYQSFVSINLLYSSPCLLFYLSGLHQELSLLVLHFVKKNISLE